MRVRSRARLAAVATVGVLTAVGCLALGGAEYAPLLGWDAAAAVFTGWVWLAVGRLSAAETEAHATREDPGVAVTDVLILIASTANLASVGLVLVKASKEGGGGRTALAALGLASIALSWLTVQTLYTLRYARLYYGGRNGGIDFNSAEPPRYRDFAYLAFTVGMTYQVSDTEIQAAAIRATVLRQALLSFVFGAVILAAAINLVGGLTSGG